MARKVLQSRQELEVHLDEHLEFLSDSSAAFDAGKDGEAKRLAVSLRVLFHDTKNSHLLLGQLGGLTREFLSTAYPYDDGNLLPHARLVLVTITFGEGVKYDATLDNAPFKYWLPFSEWWNEPIVFDDLKQTLSRRDLILALTNQDGGAHVDPTLSDTYARLSRQNSLRLMDGKNSLGVPRAEKATMRQIAHEVLRTFNR